MVNIAVNDFSVAFLLMVPCSKIFLLLLFGYLIAFDAMKNYLLCWYLGYMGAGYMVKIRDICRSSC